MPCTWANDNEKMKHYHDHDWGLPIHNDRLMFEVLSLEVFQCGLAWNTVLQKREIITRAFDHFDIDKVSRYGESDIQRIMNTPGMIRNEAKIRAVIHNAKCTLELGCLCDYLWSFTGNHILVYKTHADGGFRIAKNTLSTRISKDMKDKGFKFTGPVVMYAHLQSCGIINDHAEDCPRCREVMKDHDVLILDSDA